MWERRMKKNIRRSERGVRRVPGSSARGELKVWEKNGAKREVEKVTFIGSERIHAGRDHI